MYPIFIVAITTWLTITLNSIVFTTIYNTEQLKAENYLHEKNRLLDNIHEKFVLENDFYANQTDLENDPVNHFLKFSKNKFYYYVSPEINDGIWIFRRFALFSFFDKPTDDAGNDITPTDVLVRNDAGVGHFNVATYWKNDEDDIDLYKYETKFNYMQDIINYKLHLDEVLEKITKHYNEHSLFPKIRHDGTILAKNVYYPIKNIVGFTGTVASCNTNSFYFEDIPLECRDLFISKDYDVSYMYNDEEAYLKTTIDLKDNTNNNLVISTKIKTRSFDPET
jgi:hypothetical protein